MTTSYLPYEPRQQQLLPSALQDWLPEGHLAYFISDTIDSLDLSGFHARYTGGGARNQPFHPTMMVKVLVYGYATGVFVQVVKLARECGLAKLGTIAVDGTKIKANASRREERLEVIRAAKARLEERQRQADTARGRCPEDERRPRDPDGNPKKGPLYKHEFGTPKPKAQENFTDPQSRIMKHAGGGFDYSYNAHAAVDDTAHIIVAAELTNNSSDSARLAPLLEAVKQTAGAYPEQVLADAGFRSEPPNGWVKNVPGLRQFSMRGLSKAQDEWRLVCAALNLRRMARLMPA